MFAQLPPAPPAAVAPAPLPVQSYVQFRKEGPTPKLLTATRHARATVYALEAGQEIPPHTGPAESFMFVYQGRGLFTVGDSKLEAGAGSLVTSAKGQLHGFKALDRLVVLAFAAPNPAAERDRDGDDKDDRRDRDDHHGH